MVSNIVTRTPRKSIQNGRNRRSPIKNAATSVVAASINESINTCNHRLIKILTENTPRKKKGNKIHDKPTPTTLPPLLPPHKNTIFLDLDKTLIHSTAKTPPERYDFVVRPVIKGEEVDYFVLKRPFVDDLLAYLSVKFEIVVFTAGTEEYASLVVDSLDWRKLISHRLYRDSCKAIDGKFVKDLSETGRDLSRVLIVDDNPNSYQFQPENAIQIRPFVDDLGDEELKKLIEFFELFEGCDAVDLRHVVKVHAADLDGEFLDLV